MHTTRLLVAVGAALALLVGAGAQSATYVSYLGGAGADQARDVEVDAAGNMYVTGGTASVKFPTTPGAYDRTFNGGSSDIFVCKFDAIGSLLWCTFIGGPNHDRAYALELLSDGSLLVAGRAGNGFPTTQGALQTRFGGDLTPERAYGPQDGVIAQLSADGSRLLAATYLGSNDTAVVRGMAADNSGVYAALINVNQNSFPYVTQGAYDTTRLPIDGALVKLDLALKRVLYGTYTSGGAVSVRVSNREATVVTNCTMPGLSTTPGALQPKYGGGIGDLYVLRFTADGAAAPLRSYLGGNDVEDSETHALALDPATGRAYVGTTTRSTKLPQVVTGYQKAFGGGARASGNLMGDMLVACFEANGAGCGLTYLGGAGGEGLQGISVGAVGVVVTGASLSSNFPVTANAHQPARAPQSSNSGDAVIARLSADLSQLLYGSYLGANGHDAIRAHTQAGNSAWTVGLTQSTNLATSPGAYDPTRNGSADNLIAEWTFTSMPAPR